MYKTFTEINQFCIEYAKDRIEADNKESKNIRKLLEEGAQEFIGYGEESIIHELECPVKIAATFFGKVDSDTIKKAFENVDWSLYRESENLLAIDKINAYLCSKCKFLNKLLDNALAIQMAANVFITLDLTKELFTDYIKYLIPETEYISPSGSDSIWDAAQKVPKGEVCQSCFELANNPFNKSDLSEVIEGDEQ